MNSGIDMTFSQKTFAELKRIENVHWLGEKTSKYAANRKIETII